MATLPSCEGWRYPADTRALNHLEINEDKASDSGKVMRSHVCLSIYWYMHLYIHLYMHYTFAQTYI